MLRKLILFAITSGLAKKAWDQYRQQRAAGAAPDVAGGTRRSAAGDGLGTPPVGAQPAAPVSPAQYH